MIPSPRPKIVSPQVAFDALVAKCDRCGYQHRVTYIPLLNPPEQASHWATCPFTQQPIMVFWREHTGKAL